MRRKAVAAVLAVFAVLLVVFVKDLGAQSIFTGATRVALGAPVSAGRLSVGVLNSEILIKNLKIGQPAGFGRSVLADVPFISVHYDPGAFVKGRIHLRRLEVNVREVVVVKDRAGNLNVDALKIAREGRGGTESPMKIDRLILSIGRVIVKDSSRGEKPVVEAFDVNIEQSVVENVSGAEGVAALIVGQSLRSTALKGAAVYGATALVGVSVLPVGAAMLFTGKDSAEEYARSNMNDVWRASKRVLEELGEVLEEDRKGGRLRGTVNGSEVTVRAVPVHSHKIEISVSARKLMLPNRRAAGGVLFEILEKLK